MAELEKIAERRGRGVVVRGNDIDTDQIIPARYMRSIRFAGLEEFVFQDQRYTVSGEPKGHPFDDPRFAGAEILVVNRNFGCGSSREHAPQALKRWGIRAIVGESFAEIFFGNCTSLGVPALTLETADVDRLMDSIELDPEQEIVVDVAGLRVTSRAGTFSASLPRAARDPLLDGTWDAMRSLLRSEDAIRARAAELPYMSGFRS